ncbi:hypothetical protein AUEXF2481DRAFT_40908 [Aureobasidium subglaciale EXF-2481]|uniref:Uncharacterized protein n=1 Tax=Aureobasidium subglaciale (strain EXF-2481) TaxID=1043005 RepID=A0A074YE48_AURSE|nr:uncharacterized protein AUEXF2481DRAFT_40908 [Aureobasidium subglaciale EXF-2481]KEQ94329.1 hypothetical protein AUEXF2481DRAFT_40908 [Aureobasidium subglaciale EXF-2481]
MAHSSSYYALWTQQTHLFTEIDQLKYHTADIERQLARNQRTLVNPESKRCNRRKAKWVASSQRKYLKESERTLQFLLQALSVCQAQIARIHAEALWQADEYNNFGHQYNVSSLDENLRPTQETFRYHSRSATPDSGFSEPALYAHPFDLDLTQDDRNHIFSHQIQHPPPLSINTQILRPQATHLLPTPLSPTAGDFTPTPRATTHKAISPLAPPFSPFVFGKANPPSHSHPINSKPLFKQPVWASPLEWSEQVAAELTPVSPTSKIKEGADDIGIKRGYSVAAIELIESRLRHKRQISDAGRRVGVQG